MAELGAGRKYAPYLVSPAGGDRSQRIVLMGERRCGKSSIANVVFHKTPPSETLFTESTTEITRGEIQSFMKFNVIELPGYYDIRRSEAAEIFDTKSAVIWIIDAQDQYLDALTQLLDTITFLQQKFPSVNVEVFVHKVDGLSEEFKTDTFRDIRQRVQDELSDLGFDNAPVNFHQTSIYDYSVFEAVSGVVQKLLPQLATLEKLLNSLTSTCRIQKAYLFDIPSKIYVASDTSPQDTSCYEVCSDLIDVVVDIGELYRWQRAERKGYHAPPEIDTGNEACESLVMMEKRGYPYLYLKEMNQYLALVCIIGEDNPMEKKALIDFNISVFRDALARIFEW